MSCSFCQLWNVKSYVYVQCLTTTDCWPKNFSRGIFINRACFTSTTAHSHNNFECAKNLICSVIQSIYYLPEEVCWRRYISFLWRIFNLSIKKRWLVTLRADLIQVLSQQNWVPVAAPNRKKIFTVTEFNLATLLNTRIKFIME